MINYEQIELANGTTYQVVPNGIAENSDKTKLTITMLGEGKTLSEVDSDTDVPENVEKINVKDIYGDVIDIKKGYRYQTGCRKIKDYSIGRETIETGEFDEEGNPILEYKDVTGTVFVVELSASDIRAELENVKKKIENLNETVDMLVIDSLGVM